MADKMADLVAPVDAEPINNLFDIKATSNCGGYPLGPVLKVVIMVVMIIGLLVIIYRLSSMAVGFLMGSNKSGFMPGADTGVDTYPLGQFAVGWGNGQVAAMQGSMATGGLFATDDESVQQASSQKHTSAKNMVRCGPGYWYGEDLVRRADNGSIQMVGACYPEGDTLLNPTSANPTGGAAPTASGFTGYGPSKSGMKNYKDMRKGGMSVKGKKAPIRKSGFDPRGPEGSTVCSEMWGYDADAELGAAVMMSTYGSNRGPDEDRFEAELASLE